MKKKLAAGVAVMLTCGAVGAGVYQYQHTRAKVVTAGSASVLIDEFHFTDDSIGAGGGLLGLVNGGCLGIPGNPGAVVVWPYGTKVSGEDSDVLISQDKGKVEVGDPISVSGYLNDKILDKNSPWASKVPEACLGQKLWVVTEFERR